MSSSEHRDDPDTDGAPPIQLRQALERAGRNASVYLPVRFLPALTSLVTVPVFTRLIGPAEYGDLYLVLAASALLSHLTITWLSQSAVRFYWVSHREDQMSRYTSSTLWAAIGSLTLSSAAILLLAWLLTAEIPDGIRALLPIAVVSFFINRLVVVLLEVLKAGSRARDFAGISVLSTLAGTAISLLLVWRFEMGAWGILAGNAGGFALALPWALVKVGSLGSLAPRACSRDLLRQYLTYGMPMMVAGLSYWLLVLSDRYIIGAFRGSFETGLYSVTYGLGEKLLQLITLPLTMTMVPLMMESFEKHGQAMAARMQTSFTRYYMLATLPLLTGIAALKTDFLELFTDSAYWAAAPVLPLVAAGTLLYGLSEIGNVGIALHKRSTVSMANTAIAAGLNIAFNIVLVPRYGFMAAAYTTIGAYAVLLGLTWLRARAYMQWRIPWLSLARIVASSAGMYFVVLLTRSLAEAPALRLLLGFAAGVVSYALLATVTSAVTRREWTYVLSTARDLLGSRRA